MRKGEVVRESTSRSVPQEAHGFNRGRNVAIVIYVLKDMVYVMNLTLKVKLCPDAGQFDSLKHTMKAFNDACNFIADKAFEMRCANKIKLQPLVYHEVREKFNLSAQMAVRAISKTVEAYKLNKTVQPKFKPYGAMVYDQRILGWKGLDAVSILTLNGRIRVPVLMGEYHRTRMGIIRGQADLILVKNTFYLCVVVEVPEPDKIKSVGALGIDLGIVNLAVDSDGNTYDGERVHRIRGKRMKLRSVLQSVGTKNSKRHLKRLSGQEARFQRDTNHCISKDIVARARDTKRMIALEDLKGIRTRTTVRKAQRYYHSSWSFGQLRAFIEYKATLVGVPVEIVNPRGTSHICPMCRHECKENRPSRDKFTCIRCAFAGRADHVAAMNIAARVTVNAPIVPRDIFSDHVGSPSGTSPRL